MQKPWMTTKPNRSLGIFDEIGGVLDARNGRKAQEAKAQQTLEDRIIAGQQRDAANHSRTIEDALNEARTEGERAKAAPKPPAAPKIISTKEDPVTGEVTNLYDDGTAKPVTMPESGGILGAIKPFRMGVKPKEVPPEDKTLVPVQQPDGSVIYTPRSQAAGAKVPSPNSSGSASMQKALASNEMQMSVIDDAVKELGAHESAVGVGRGLPLVGDFLDQRIDTGGVAARAQIANIGSMIFHDRSGAAITVSEAPRLKPFIPSIHDTPETIRTKLRKLREALEVENGFLRGNKAPAGPLGGRAAPAKSGVPSFEEWQAAKKSKGTP